jgi:hypothetical protein
MGTAILTGRVGAYFGKQPAGPITGHFIRINFMLEIMVVLQNIGLYTIPFFTVLCISLAAHRVL